jgi:hypothetical protein
MALLYIIGEGVAVDEAGVRWTWQPDGSWRRNAPAAAPHLRLVMGAGGTEPTACTARAELSGHRIETGR